MKKILSCIQKADRDYNLINDKDYIAIGVSGGKDSMVLLYCMKIYQLVAKKVLDKEFEIIAIHIDMNFEGMDFTEIDNFCKEENIKIHHEKSKIYDILQLHKKNEQIQCSLCSKLKKGAVNRVAKELGCNKVAFGHHADDAIETLLMNAIYCGKLATFTPSMYLSNIDIDFIRPLIYAYEKDIISTLKKEKIPFVESTCPNEGITKRNDTKELLENLYKKYPSSKVNFLNMLSNTENVKLWDKINEFEE
jgi:tRNA(Ile)-lysidine synthase TilS/MesJ